MNSQNKATALVVTDPRNGILSGGGPQQPNTGISAFRKTAFALALLPLLALLSACVAHARLPAVGWTDGATPTPAADMKVTAFAEGLDHPRWL